MTYIVMGAEGVYAGGKYKHTFTTEKNSSEVGRIATYPSREEQCNFAWV
jgi:hypothetical protein